LEAWIERTWPKMEGDADVAVVTGSTSASSSATTRLTRGSGTTSRRIAAADARTPGHRVMHEQVRTRRWDQSGESLEQHHRIEQEMRRPVVVRGLARERRCECWRAGKIRRARRIPPDESTLTWSVSCAAAEAAKSTKATILHPRPRNESRRVPFMAFPFREAPILQTGQ